MDMQFVLHLLVIFWSKNIPVRAVIFNLFHIASSWQGARIIKAHHPFFDDKWWLLNSTQNKWKLSIFTYLILRLYACMGEESSWMIHLKILVVSLLPLTLWKRWSKCIYFMQECVFVCEREMEGAAHRISWQFSYLYAEVTSNGNPRCFTNMLNGAVHE